MYKAPHASPGELCGCESEAQLLHDPIVVTPLSQRQRPDTHEDSGPKNTSRRHKPIATNGASYTEGAKPHQKKGRVRATFGS